MRRNLETNEALEPLFPVSTMTVKVPEISLITY